MVDEGDRWSVTDGGRWSTIVDRSMMMIDHIRSVLEVVCRGLVADNAGRPTIGGRRPTDR